MAKKKLLNEAQVRRFMGLAGIKPLKEMYGKKEEEMKEAGTYMEEEEMNENIYEDEEEEEAEPAPEPEMDMEPMGDDDVADEPEEDDEETVELDQEDVDALDDLAQKLPQIVAKLKGGEAPDEMGDEMGEPAMDEPELDADPLPEPAAGDQDLEDEAEEPIIAEEVIEEALNGVNLKLSEQELVNEVARRVAKRILKAKRAQKELNEALGRTKTKATK